ncbi:hypothetical protein [Sphaerotilus mobilis]|uniref:Uncharacterized protein n=1 Tax=Sphaerotilus mobilis TaxID=47994 RepID=A0A4Q7LUJ0_9BURK|nr:hypothetical protein [Sphaerotilus mobilis]RZS57877.1 hypothetical protein EV685_0150 [Sphaerotilus mobilis]
MRSTQFLAATIGLTLAGGAAAHGGHGSEGHVHDLLAELFGALQAEPSLTLWLVVGAIAVGLLLARKGR